MNNSECNTGYVGGVGEGDLEAWEDAERAAAAITIEQVKEEAFIPDIDREEPSKHEARKAAPIFSGVMNYFPDAIWQVARCSKIGNDQHNDPSLPMHWDRNKSTDEPDALLRHLMQYDEMDDDGLLHATKVAWRSLALLQRTLEARGEAPLANHT